MALTLVDPGGRRSSTARTMAPRLTDLTGLNIGLLSNGKANADALLNETAALFIDAYGCRTTRFVDKRNAGRPALPEHHQELAAAADFLITAVGD